MIACKLSSLHDGMWLRDDVLVAAWLATLGAEYLLASGKGLGNTLIDGREHFWMDLVLFGVVVIGLVGFALNWLLAAAERRLLAWRDRTVAKY